MLPIANGNEYWIYIQMLSAKILQRLNSDFQSLRDVRDFQRCHFFFYVKTEQGSNFSESEEILH